MKIMKPIVGIAAALALVATPLTAAYAADDTTKGSAIRLGADLDQIDTLNPFTSIFDVALNVLSYQYYPLAGIDESGDYGGLLADDFSAEGNVWTYHIRDNAKWSDGEPVVADDVVWTYESVKNSKDMQVANGESVGNIEKVTAVDDKTVTFETNAPTALHPGILPIVPKHIWEKLDDPATYENTEDVVGSGPFVISDYKRGTSITMLANPNFYGGAPGVDKLLISGFKNTDAMVLALRNGEIDMVGDLSSAQFDSLKDVKGIETYQAESKHFWNLTINPGWKTTSGEAFGTNAKVLEDQAFRQAIGQAIDRKTLVDRVINGQGSEGPAMIPPGSPGGFFTQLEGVARTQGTEEAVKSLEAAGYTTDAAGNRLDKDGNPITLRLMYNGSSTANTATAEFVTSWFKDLGIPLDVKTTNWDEMSGNLIPKGDYDMYIDGWGVGQDPDYMLSINVCSTLPDAPATRGASQVGMCLPEYDAVYQAQHTELDPAARKELVIEAQKLIYEYGAVAMFYFDDALGAYNSDTLDNLVVVKGSPNNRFSIAQATVKGADESSTGGSDGGSQGWLIGGGIGLVALIAIGVVVGTRRKKSADDRK